MCGATGVEHSFLLSVTAGYNVTFTVDWGDGTSDEYIPTGNYSKCFTEKPCIAVYMVNVTCLLVFYIDC